MKRRYGRSGFALMLVMMVLAMAVVLGLSYVSSSSVKLASSNNLLQAARAKYLAESGIQHAIYVMQTNPALLDGSQASPLGPFYADDSSDSYIFYAVADDPIEGRFTLFAEATVGGITQRSWMTVRLAADQVTAGQALLVDSGTILLPNSVTVTGDFHINGTLINLAAIDGNASATEAITDFVGGITGTITENAEPMETPGIQWNQYTNYSLFGWTYDATELVLDKLGSKDPVTKGNAITATNPAGVVWLKPASGTSVVISKNVSFQGTLIIDGNLILDGQNIVLEAVNGFPALVVSGNIYITNNAFAPRTTITGIVAVGGGIMPKPGEETTEDSETTINGALIATYRGYGHLLGGDHQLNHVPERCVIWDMAGTEGIVWTVQIIDVGD